MLWTHQKRWSELDRRKGRKFTLHCVPNTSVHISPHQSTSVHISPLSCNISFHTLTAPSRPGPPHYRDFTITPRNTTLSRTPLDEWSARRRDLYLTTHNIYKRHTSMPPVGFEPAIPASDRPQPHSTDRATTAIIPVILGKEISHRHKWCLWDRNSVKP